MSLPQLWETGGEFCGFIMCNYVAYKLRLFTVLHGMQTRSSAENSCLSVCLSLSSVHLSVCPSVKRMHCDETQEKSAQNFIPHERPFSLDFWEKEWLLGATPSTWNFCSSRPRWSMECRRGLAMRILSVCPSLCPSDRLSVKRVHYDKQKEK